MNRLRSTPSRSGARRRPVRAVVATGAVVSALVLSACSTKANDSSGGSGGTGTGDAGALKTDFGVTDSTISLGLLTDLSGVFATLGKTVTQGAQIYFDELNNGEKLCGRSVKLVIKDDGYDVQKAVGQYANMSQDVLGFEQLLGSPINAALKENIQTDKMFTIPVSWASTLLDNPYNMIVGATYDLEMINGVSFLVDKGVLKKGDKIGHIYIEGEYGENGFRGTTYAAKQLGLKVVAQKITATETDVTSQVTALKNQGVKAIALTATPTQTASAAAVDAATGLNVPLLGNNPVFAPQLLDTAAGPALEKLLYVAASWEPYSGQAAGTTKVRQAYGKKYPKEIPNAGVTWGYGAAVAYANVLKKACDNGDMTRDGVQKAFRETSSIDTDGILPTLDYSSPGSPATREVLVVQPDKTVEGALKVVQPLTESAAAKSYKAPEQK